MLLSKYSERSLHFLGVLTFILYLCFVCIAEWQRSIPLVLGLFAVLAVVHFFSCALFVSSSSLSISRWIIFWGLLFRLIVLFDTSHQEKLLSSDIYRYVWEGVVLENDYNPYVFAPSDSRLSRLQEGYHELWSKVQHKDVPAIYPPFSQYLFSILPKKVFVFRLVFTLFDFGTLIFLVLWLKRQQAPPGRVIVYAWMPLPIIEICSSGHLESLMVFLCVVAMYLYDCYSELISEIFAVCLLALGVLVKFIALVPFAFVFFQIVQRRGWLTALLHLVFFCSTICLFYLPFVKQGVLPFQGLQTYAEHWEFNSLLFPMILELLAYFEFFSDPRLYAKLLTVLAVFVLFAFLLLQKIKPVPGSIILLLSLLVFSSVVYPWYLLWFAPFLVIDWQKPNSFLLLGFCSSSLLSYEVLAHPEYWVLALYVKIAIYSPLIVLGFMVLRLMFVARKNGD